MRHDESVVNPGAEDEDREIDVLYVVALPEELDAVRTVASNGFLSHPGVTKWSESDDSYAVAYSVGRFVISDEVSFTVAICDLPRMGGDAAARVLGALIERLKPACLAMSGVCAGHPGEVALGDVIVADTTYQRLEGKMTLAGLRADVRTYSPSAAWVRAAHRLRVDDLSGYRAASYAEGKQWLLNCLFTKRDPLLQPDRDRYLLGDQWQDSSRELSEDGLITIRESGSARLTPLGRATVLRTRRENRDWPDHLPFNVSIGPIASGPFVDASDPWTLLTSAGVRTVLGLEMEAAAVGSAAYASGIPYWIVAKGVMDHAQPAKDDRYKRFCAQASAEVVWKFLVEQRIRHPETVIRSPGVRGGALSASTPSRIVLPRTNLPELTDTFVGRQHELDMCRSYLAEKSRLITIVGPPGAGKTRLAVELALSVRGSFEDCLYLVDMAVVSDPDLVFASITESLRIEAGDPLLDALRELFRGVPVLMILDNFEQVAAAAPRITDMLRAVPDLTIVVTSQGPLHLRSERILDLAPLQGVDAEALFNSRAGYSGNSDAALSSVAEICNLLDGLPLAIEIVAAHAAALTPQHVSKVGIASDLIRLRNLLLDVSSRQETVESSIRWSFELLTVEQRELFVSLAIFEGGWTLGAAARIVWQMPEGMRAAELMRELLDRRFVYIMNRDDREPRFRMLTPLREFGLAILLNQDGLLGELTSRHATYYEDVVMANAAELRGAQRAETLSLLARDHANIHAALKHYIRNSEARSALRMSVALDPYWWARNYKEGFRELVAVLTLPLPNGGSRDDRILRARASFAAGKLALRQFLLEQAREYFQVVQSIGVNEDDRGLEAAGLEREALIDIEQHLYDDARRKLEQALDIDNAVGDDNHAADCLDGLGIVACEAGLFERGTSLYAEAIDRYPVSDGLQPRAWVRVDLAQANLLLRRRTEARQDARFAHEVGLSHGDLGLMMWAEHSLGLLDVLDENFDNARENLTQSLTRAMLLGNFRPRLRALEGFAVLAAATNKTESALTLLAALDSIREQTGLRRAETEQAMIRPVFDAAIALSDAARIRAVDAGGQKTLEQATELARAI